MIFIIIYSFFSILIYDFIYFIKHSRILKKMLDFESTKHAVNSLNKIYLMAFDRALLQLQCGFLEQVCIKDHIELMATVQRQLKEKGGADVSNSENSTPSSSAAIQSGISDTEIGGSNSDLALQLALGINDGLIGLDTFSEDENEVDEDNEGDSEGSYAGDDADGIDI
jgi:hypothetical protein